MTLDPADLPDDAELLIVNALAMRGFPPPMPGCEIRVCAVCGRDTWAAPSSLEAEKLRPTRYLCRSCGILLSRMVGGIDAHRLPDAERDVTAPGSLVTPEGEAAFAERFRAGR